MEKEDFSKLSEEERVEKACFSMDPELLDFLSTDKNIFVRSFVAMNEYTAKETLKKMKENDEEFVKALIEI